MFSIEKIEMELAGRKLKISTGKIARQANGSVMIEYGKTVLLVTAVMKNEPREGIDFFPLTVDFVEKYFAAGKFPGGFLKREARPSTNATLTARLVDRPLRPMFPDGFFNEVQVVATVLSFEEDNATDALAIIGASAALSISDIPFNGPVASVCVGCVNDEFIINPTIEQLSMATLDLKIAGTKSAVTMVESSASEMSEDQILKAVMFGHDKIKEIIEFQDILIEKIGKTKIDIPEIVVNKSILNFLETNVKDRLEKAVTIFGKLERQNTVEELETEIMAEYFEKNEIEEEEQSGVKKELKKYYHDFMKKLVREAILYKHHRADGRKVTEVRPIETEIDILPMPHGSALFTRGETQSVGTVTLGSKEDEQLIDGLGVQRRDKFLLHYNFPQYSVGEVGFMRGPGRRELGHGELAKRALNYVLPTAEEFPYTIRVVSDITESNGSSSMATVCAGSMALMAAGVPIKAPVAGIAMGLIKEGDEFVVLSDIMGLEDHLGDMDFKVAGTSNGITALQMDIKIEGITREIMEIALRQALVARTHILSKMETAINVSRSDVAPHVPRIESLKIAKDMISTLIGPGGKNIREIIEITGVKIDINDEGIVNIFAVEKSAMEAAKTLVERCTKTLKVGEVYKGKVMKIMKFGAFVSLIQGKDGLLHISEVMPGKRVKTVEEVLKEGQEITVKIKEIDKGGKVSLTRIMEE